jgi:hypothetical protein
MATKYHRTEGRKLQIPPVDIANLRPNEDMATKEQVHEFSSKVGSAQYVTTITRPDAAKATSHLAKFLANPSRDHIHAIDQVISFLYQSRFKALWYKRSARDSQHVKFFSDASFGDNPGRKSSAGFLCMAFGGPVDWKAAK